MSRYLNMIALLAITALLLSGRPGFSQFLAEQNAAMNVNNTLNGGQTGGAPNNPRPAAMPGAPGMMGPGMMGPGMMGPGMMGPGMMGPGMMGPAMNANMSPTPSPTPTPKHYSAVKGQRIFDAVSYRQNKENALILDDVRQLEITEDEVGEYSDDGKTLGDIDIDGQYSQILPPSTNEYIGARSNFYLSRVVTMLQQADAMDPLQFFGGTILTNERVSQVGNIRERMMDKNKKMLDEGESKKAGWTQAFLKDYRFDQEDPDSKFFPLYVPLAPQPPAVAPPPAPWKPMNHPDVVAMKAGEGGGGGMGMMPGRMGMPGMMGSGVMPAGGMVSLPTAIGQKLGK